MFNKSSRPEGKEPVSGGDQAPEKNAQDAVMVEEREESLQGEPGAPEFSGAESLPERQENTEYQEQSEWPGRYQLLQDQFARLAADFDNFRKRVREEQEQLARFGAQKTVAELLPVLDNLERASGSLTENSDPQVLFKSFSLMQKQLMDALEGMGVQRIKAIGQEFDPQFHEAINRMESAEFLENTVMFEGQAGYMLNGKVLRPAMVVVSTGASDGTPAGTSDETASEASVATETGEKANPFRG